jgi:pyruvate,water dikinase
MGYLLDAKGADDYAPLGGKARALAALGRADLPIPAWFALRPGAFYDSLTDEHKQALERTTDAQAIRTLVNQAHLPAEAETELRSALAQLCPGGELLAVRSSASDEDGVQHSFAGQLESFLFVAPADVPQKIQAVWQSGFSDRLLAYRREHGLSLLPRAPAVLIQQMVPADVSGVAFGADPVTGRRGVAVVSAVFGLGTALVSGECDADTYHVDQDGRILERTIAHKTVAHRQATGTAEGVAPVPIDGALAARPALTDEQVLAVAELVRRCGRHFGRPQDIEWAIANGRLFLLQSRPITSLARLADPDGVFCLWDNSNIAESYNGITTPLTFSFARRAYEEVYRQFCRILRVPEEKVATSDEVFRHMLGLIRGRVYYNLLNWYRLLALLPGYRANRRFMEQMMGVKEPLPEQLVNELGQSTWRERWSDRLRLLRSIGALIHSHWTINHSIRRFYQRLNQALGQGRPELEKLRPDELAACYRSMERQLITRWDAPLLNDFLAMIFYGVLGKLTRKWCKDPQGTLQNNLLCGEGGMISAEPAIRVRRLAELASKDGALTIALCEGTTDDVQRELERSPAFRAELTAYLDKFGDRCLEELKLESPTLVDEPQTLWRSVGQLARRLADHNAPLATGSEAAIRQEAEQRVRTALGFRLFRRFLFGWVLKHSRARVRDRENLRFERTRLFGRVRRLFVEMGRCFHELDLLDHPRDIFYLEVNEILGFVTGTATSTNLRALAALRKQEFAAYRDQPSPAERFATRGVVYQGNTFEGQASGREELNGEARQGLGCCPGVVEGLVRVIRDPRNAHLEPGAILVAERTDPGWIMLFPAAAGVLVERGSLLSHSAIVARELGIPAIVSIPGVTRWLQDGDRVELNGSTGVVTRIRQA